MVYNVYNPYNSCVVVRIASHIHRKMVEPLPVAPKLVLTSSIVLIFILVVDVDFCRCDFSLSNRSLGGNGTVANFVYISFFVWPLKK